MAIPVPSKAWLSEARLIDDVSECEAVAHMLAWIGQNEDEFLTWRTGDLQAADLTIMNATFAVALVYLHFDWKKFERPVLSLESLVSAFGVRGLDAMRVGDGNLPPSVAGAGSDESAKGAYEWQQRLVGYVRALFEEGWLSHASPISKRYFLGRTAAIGR